MHIQCNAYWVHFSATLETVHEHSRKSLLSIPKKVYCLHTVERYISYLSFKIHQNNGAGKQVVYCYYTFIVKSNEEIIILK